MHGQQTITWHEDSDELALDFTFIILCTSVPPWYNQWKQTIKQIHTMIIPISAIFSTAVNFSSANCLTFLRKLQGMFRKVKQSGYRPEQAQRVDRGIALTFPDLGARRGCVVSIMPRPLYPRMRPGTHCTGGWVGPRVGLNVCEISRPHRDSIPGPSSP
jgi:hypothetical protein